MAFPSPSQNPTIQEKLQILQNAWDTGSANCQFQHYLYNMVHPDEVKFYQRSPQDKNDALWERALQDNPDPSCMVPVVAVGFGDLVKRREKQDAQMAVYLDKLKDISHRLYQLTGEKKITVEAQLKEAQRKHHDLFKRVLQLVRHTAYMHASNHPLDQSEQKLRESVEQISTLLPNVDEFQVRTAEMKTSLHRLQDQAYWKRTVLPMDNPSLGSSTLSGSTGGGITAIQKVLQEQQTGLENLIQIILQDQQIIQTIEKA